MAKASKSMGTAVDAESAFYDAIARADINALMALWAEDDEIVCVHPGGGRLAGHAEIRASWEQIFERGGVHIGLGRQARQNIIVGPALHRHILLRGHIHLGAAA